MHSTNKNKKNEQVFNKLIKTDPNKHELVDELECRIPNLIVGLGFLYHRMLGCCGRFSKIKMINR
ncbi:MAG: hypothetical protein ACKPKO_06465, partial [Candidatus Fonsibacter sp.]